MKEGVSVEPLLVMPTMIHLFLRFGPLVSEFEYLKFMLVAMKKIDGQPPPARY